MADLDAAREPAPAPFLVLVVDPNPLRRDLLLELLEDAGLPSRGTADGWAALALAERRRPRAVLLSWAVDRPDAASVIQRPRAWHGPALPIVALLGRQDPEAEALRAGATR